jgi:hypothetical protein
MGSITPAERSEKSDEDQRDNRRSQDRVRGQQGEVDGPDHSLPREMPDPRCVVIRRVRYQKGHRTGEGAEHAGAMSAHPSSADLQKAEQQQRRARQIERGVDSRKIRDRHDASHFSDSNRDERDCKDNKNGGGRLTSLLLSLKSLLPFLSFAFFLFPRSIDTP